jgi:transposase
MWVEGLGSAARDFARHYFYLPARFPNSPIRRSFLKNLSPKKNAPSPAATAGQLRLLDCTLCMVHQHGLNPAGGQAAQAIGRTKGRLNPKIAAVVDPRGRPLALALAPVWRHDTRAVQPVLAAMWRHRLVADTAFDSAAFRAHVRRRQSRACIPPRRGRRSPARFHRGYYRARHLVENYFGRLNCYRRVATRYENLPPPTSLLSNLLPSSSGSLFQFENTP